MKAKQKIFDNEKIESLSVYNTIHSKIKALIINMKQLNIATQLTLI